MTAAMTAMVLCLPMYRDEQAATTHTGATVGLQTKASNKFIGTWQCDSLGRVTFKDFGGSRTRGDFHEGANAKGFFDGMLKVMSSREPKS
jgi:hypothetical protein